MLERISRGDLEASIGESRPDELGKAGEQLDLMTRELKERRKISKFVAPQVMEVISRGDLKSAADGRLETVAILCSDIRNFTTLSECHSPQELFAALNEHVQAMVEAIQHCKGVVDRFIGDAVVAVFYPIPGTDQRLRAVAAAQEMVKAHQQITSRRRMANLFTYEIGVGIDAG